MHRAAAAAFANLLALPAGAAAQAACLIGPHGGIAPEDAETVTSIVCSQLRKNGEQVGDPVVDAGGTEAWRVSLRPLGEKVFLSLQRIDEDGAVGAESELLLQRIEEVPTAAPRLVQSALTGRPIEETATVNTLVGEETRRYRKRDGESFFGLGFMAMGVPGTDVIGAGGFLARWAFETEDFGVLTDLRVGGGGAGDDSATFFSLGVGGRWFLTDGNVSPFLGVGLGWTALGVEEHAGFDGDEGGAGAWVELGFEALRFYETRLSVDLRAELPFFELDDDSFWSKDPGRRSYYVPITLGVSYLF